MSIEEITSDNITYLNSFLNHSFPPTFRYFSDKSPCDIIKNHYKTLMYIDNDFPLGYAHIDYDIVNDTHWFGLCVLPEYHGKGIGTKLILKTLEYFHHANFNSLHLTVDKTNIIAYNLYIKYGFNVLRQTSMIYIMQLTKSNILYLPVSFGEAVDKLTILDIKMNKINDSRKEDVEREYQQLSHALRSIISRVTFQYDCLKQINLQIWENQDLFRYSVDDEVRNILCKKIIEDNDARFRIKNKINVGMNSILKEQKGYNHTVFQIHYTMNESYHMLLNSIIKYQSIFHDKVIVTCTDKDKEQLVKLFSYDPSIQIISSTCVIEPSIKDLEKTINNTLFFNYINGYGTNTVK
jgi:ribosomal protein S18 acetylase RimI-like enzyme